MYESDIVANYILVVYVLQQIWYCCWQIEQIVVYQSKGEVTGETSQKTLHH